MYGPPPPDPHATRHLGRPSSRRLLAQPGGHSLAAHLSCWGPLEVPADLVAEVGRARLGERGPGRLPTALRMSAVMAAAGGVRRHPVVVASGCEDDPLSAGSRALLWRSPHLVLDGLAAACAAVTADRAILCVDEGQEDLQDRLRAAAGERQDQVGVEVLAVPSTLAGRHEPALVSWLTHRRPRAAAAGRALAGVGGRATLVERVEILAAVAAVARFGAPWWGGVGKPGEPGTLLLTLTGGVRRPGVVEVPVGTPLADVLWAAGADEYAAVLVGGLSGTWLSPDQAGAARLSTEGLSGFGTGVGNGVVAPMPLGCCPVGEVTSMIRWFADRSDEGRHSVGRVSLPSLVAAWERLAAGDRSGQAAYEIVRFARAANAGPLSGPSAGVSSFVASAFRVFAEHLAVDHRQGPCLDAPSGQILRRPAVAMAMAMEGSMRGPSAQQPAVCAAGGRAGR